MDCLKQGGAKMVLEKAKQVTINHNESLSAFEKFDAVDCKGIVLYELLQQNQTLNLDKFCS